MAATREGGRHHCFASLHITASTLSTVVREPMGRYGGECSRDIPSLELDGLVIHMPESQF
jgi:hypothetical protein